MPGCCEIEVILQDSSELEIELWSDSLDISEDEFVRVIATDAETYEGPYEAVPSWEQQTFGTASRIMSQDFAVDSIIKLEAPNDAGGLTITI